MMAQEVQRPPQMAKWMLNAQVFLLRRGWMGPMNRQLMVLTTTGRKSGKTYSIPVGFAPDGSDVWAFTLSGGRSNWYRNIQVNPRVTLEIQGKTIQADGELMNTPEQRRQAIEVYKRERPEMFERFFKVSHTLPTDELLTQMGDIRFARFRPAR
jgi:deazaflavin-dependent oxidoreductase (nitroreductase family)